jgi:DNA-binding LytR/AlgR family response regulator
MGDQYIPINIEDIAYFVFQNSATWIVNKEGVKYIVDHSLDQLENMINPLDFYRVNRQMIISTAAIEEIRAYFNSRLLIRLKPQCEEEIIVSRDRVAEFKRWMDL